MKKYTTLLLLVLLTIFGCRNNIVTADTIIEDESDIPDWTTASHSNSVDPDYSIVFEQDAVLRIDIEINSENWEIMQSDLASNVINSGPRQFDNSDYTPVWVPCSFNFDGIEWYNVGVRFKGNSSLQSTYKSGNGKLPFKLDFDQFEDDYPLLTDQRFYGFKQLNLKNNYDDESLAREKVASDLFIDFGLPSAQTTFCELYIDHGSGSQYYGVYTIVEEIDDSLIKDQFFSEAGNLYKPEGTGATFASGTYNDSDMNLKIDYTGDYADVESLYNIINSSDRTTDAESWKTNLETVFDVDHFLKWLAANTVMQNWDTYGVMTHNYYLFNNPDNSKLTWIPWDGNEALQDGKQGGALSLSLNEVSSNWPLIRYIINVDEYEDTYKNYISEFVENVFNSNEMQSIYNDYYTLLKDYAYAEDQSYSFLENDSDFDSAIQTLINHVQSRNGAVQSYLN